MNFLLDTDGPILNVAPAWYAVHQKVADELGWSSLDRTTFWRLTRKQGKEAVVLPGARLQKLDEYYIRFFTRLEEDDIVAALKPYDGVDYFNIFCILTRQGSCSFITLGSNLQARSAVLKQRDLMRFATEFQHISDDPRRRPMELKTLAGSDRRSVVIAASDLLIRSANDAGIVTVGLFNGPCSKDRLHRSGVDLVYADLEDFAEVVKTGGRDLIRAGLLPPAME